MSAAGAVMPDLGPGERLVLDRRAAVSPREALLVGLSGVDGSGKGFIAAELRRRLERDGLRVAVLHADGWLSLPGVRFSRDWPAENFYIHALRLDEMFRDLVLPLRQRRTRRVVARHAEETATAYRDELYDIHDVDVIVLEGIFIYKRQYRRYFDLALWLDCTFETAMERALRRGQEGLPRAETVAAYEKIYFPAQRLHFRQDEPRARADVIMANDPRLVPVEPFRSVGAFHT